MEMPVYLFTGYLEAGKTKFIQETLEDPRFNSGERILVLLCEEGEEELDPSTYPGNGENITVHSIEERSKITPDRLAALGKRSGAERVMVEYNGMWELDTLYNNLPDGWFVCQEVMIADATTYLTYNTNMRQQTVDKLQSAEVVIFNRVTPETERLPLHKIVRGISRRAQILYETVDGEL
jgi:G3E family GTPase